MTKAIAIAALICALASIGTGSLSAASKARKFAPHQEPRGIGNLIARSDRVTLVYDAGVKSATGFAYVRNDQRPKFVRLALAPERGRGAASTFSARVPARLIRGHRLRYYAVLRDRTSRRTARVPARGTSSALILGHPQIVDLGMHTFGETRSPDQVVARARADQVGWQLPPPGQGPKAGPQSFLVGPDHTIYLHDSFNDRMLVWNVGDPEQIARTVPLPDRTADNDVALGPDGSLYVTHGEGVGLDYHLVLKRLTSTGETMWTSGIAGDFFGDSQSFVIGANSSLRTGSDGTLHVLAGMFGLPGGEFGWMPIATPDGRPIPMGQQHRRTSWPYQPMAAGQRLVTEVYTAVPDSAPHEVRVAIVNSRGNIVHAWRVLSRTDINLHDTPDVLRGAPTLVLDATEGEGESFKWEYLVLRLVPDGSPISFSVPHMVFGDNLLADVRMSSTFGGGVYQLRSSPSFGVQILRYSF
jgi:hypothetical protein